MLHGKGELRLLISWPGNYPGLHLVGLKVIHNKSVLNVEEGFEELVSE